MSILSHVYYVLVRPGFDLRYQLFAHSRIFVQTTHSRYLASQHSNHEPTSVAPAHLGGEHSDSDDELSIVPMAAPALARLRSHSQPGLHRPLLRDDNRDENIAPRVGGLARLFPREWEQAWRRPVGVPAPAGTFDVFLQWMMPRPDRGARAHMVHEDEKEQEEYLPPEGMDSSIVEI